MVTEERGQERGERNVSSFPETKVHSIKTKQPATTSWLRIIPKRDEAVDRASTRQPSGSTQASETWSARSTSPASPGLWLD